MTPRQRALNSKLYWIAGQIVTCESKRAYRNQATALICGQKFKSGLTAYRCPVCGDWHLTKGKMVGRGSVGAGARGQNG